MPNLPSGQVVAPTLGTAKVRFEFAGRAHRREFTPKLEIKGKESIVKEKEEILEMKGKEGGAQLQVVLEGELRPFAMQWKRCSG